MAGKLKLNGVTLATEESGSVTLENTSLGDSVLMPVGATAERPVSPQAGMYRLNTTIGEPEWYDATSSSWIKFANSPIYEVEYLIVAGGGGGSRYDGSMNWGGGGGGGGGGYRSSVSGENSGTLTLAEPPLLVSSGFTYSVIVGAGGSQATNGGDSSIGILVSIGGGASGNRAPGASGGSGGGGGGGANTETYLGGSGTTGQGFSGGTGGADGVFGAGGGGGGAGSIGSNSTTKGGSGSGGDGISSEIDGSLTTRSIGGGGNTGISTSPDRSIAISGDPNTGNGGNGTEGATPGSGGSGVVIIRYLGPQRGTGGTVTTVGDYTVHTFTSSGTYTA